MKRVLLIVAVLALTVPRAHLDYGQSGDAWDNARDARVLRDAGLNDGVPQLVRFPPGVPLFLYLLMPVAGYGALATNALVFAFYAASVVLFWFAIRGREHDRLLAVTFALTPILLRNAVVTQDFVVGLAFVLAAYLALRHSQYGLAGLFIGLSAGVRITNILFVIPAIAFVCLQARLRWRSRILISGAIGVTAAGLAGLLFLPLLAYAGPELFVPGEAFGTFRLLPALPLAAFNLISVFGVQALLALAVLMLVQGRRMAARVRCDVRQLDAGVVFAALAIAIHLAIVVRFTMKPEYFLPAVPFVHVLLARYLSHRALVLVCVLLVSHAFIAIDLKGGRSGQRSLAFRPAPGLVVEDYLERREMRDVRRGSPWLASLGRAIVLTGVGGTLTMDNPAFAPATPGEISPRLGSDAAWTVHRQVGSPVINRVAGSDVFVLAAMSQRNVNLLRADGYRVLMFDKHAPGAIRSTFGYDPYAAGIEIVATSGPSAFYRVGG